MSVDRPARRVGAWRYPLVALALVMAIAHIPVTEDHLDEAPYIGALFIVLEIAGLLLAVLLSRRESTRDYWLVAATGALAIAAYVVSRAVGLPQIQDDVGNWGEPLGVVSLVDEFLLAAGAVIAARTCGRTRRLMLPRPAAALAAAVALVVGIGITVIASAAEPSDDGMGDAMSMSGSSY